MVIASVFFRDWRSGKPKRNAVLFTITLPAVRFFPEFVLGQILRNNPMQLRKAFGLSLFATAFIY